MIKFHSPCETTKINLVCVKLVLAIKHTEFVLLNVRDVLGKGGLAQLRKMVAASAC